MRFMAKHLSLICFICLQSLVCSRLTDGKVSRKHGSEKVKNSGQRKLSQSRSLHLQRKSKEKGLAVNGIQKNILRPLIANCDGPDCCEGPRCVEMPLPIHIEHLKDYPVPVPVREETTENVLHVHIHDKNPCKNGGVLSREFSGRYHCVCPSQYAGTTCEIQQYCFSGPCKNGGKCLEISNGYKCTCLAGFTGNDCEEKMPCSPNPCEHGGKCVETLQGYKCVCQDGYTGVNCKDTDACWPNPCQHGGSCETLNGVARCQCHPEYYGTYCHERYICYVNPCHNGGRCVENPLAPCLCSRGYVGKHCLDHVCRPNPCLHEGSCRVVNHPLGSRNDRWKYHCICSELYRGHICHIPHPCTRQPCLNGGTCVDAFTSKEENEEQPGYEDVALPWTHMHFSCRCPPGFTGSRCEIDVCSLCHPYADCIDHHCVCKRGYVGDGNYCKNKTDLCHPNPCLNQGTCSEGVDGTYDCQCVPGYCGPQCKDICKPCLLWPCLHGGKCIPKGEKRICICTPPYVPPDCNATITDLCNPNPCKNGGKCKFLPEKNDYICEDCLGRFTGKDCEDCDCPKAKPRSDGRPVVDAICDQVGECMCPSIPDGGELTFTPNGCVGGAANPCANNPCVNGRCVVTSGFEFECVDCPPPYYGRLCECTSCTCEKPCKNGATCVDIATKQYKCTCPPGYTGVDCSVPIPPIERYCLYKICQHGGTCVERPHGYDCICTPQYTGPHCGVDKCANCHVDAECVYGRCRCMDGYIGTGYVCEKEKKECGVCPVHHHCVQGECVCIPGSICQGYKETECGVCPVHHRCDQGVCVCIPGFICQDE